MLFQEFADRAVNSFHFYSPPQSAAELHSVQAGGGFAPIRVEGILGFPAVKGFLAGA